MMIVQSHPQQQPAPSSSHRRSSQKANHKKSANSQHRKSKQRISIHAHQAQTNAGNKNRVFNLIVSNQGEPTLKPV